MDKHTRPRALGALVAGALSLGLLFPAAAQDWAAPGEDFAKTAESPMTVIAQSLARGEALLNDQDLKAMMTEQRRICAEDSTSVDCHELAQRVVTHYQGVIKEAKVMFTQVLDASARTGGQAGGQAQRQSAMLDKKRAELQQRVSAVRNANAWSSVSRYLGGAGIAEDPRTQAILRESQTILDNLQPTSGRRALGVEAYRTRAEARLFQLEVIEMHLEVTSAQNQIALLEAFTQQFMNTDAAPVLPEPVPLPGFDTGQRAEAQRPITAEDVYNDF